VHTNSRRDGRAGQRADDVARPPAARLAAPKKSLYASERDPERVQQARADCRELMETLAIEPLKFIDKSGVALAMPRIYGRTSVTASMLISGVRQTCPMEDLPPSV
jgi:hypothetical protein